MKILIMANSPQLGLFYLILQHDIPFEEDDGIFQYGQFIRFKTYRKNITPTNDIPYCFYNLFYHLHNSIG